MRIMWNMCKALRIVTRVYVYIVYIVYLCRYIYLPWWLSGKESACNARDVG